MTTGQLYINDRDAWLTWGVYLVGDSIDNLLLPAAPKPYTENNFRSQHGKQMFIVNPKKEAREVSVEFCIQADTRANYLTAYEAFVEALTGLVVFRLPEFNKEYSLVVSGFLNLGYYGKFGKLSVRFTEPFSAPVIFNALAAENGSLILTEDNKTILI